jgi:ribose 1,5-bisphosphate isomerase
MTPPKKLPAHAQLILDEMKQGQVQGLSHRIRQINDLFVATSLGWDGESKDLVATLKEIGYYLIETRGQNAPAIGNAIKLTLKGIDEYESSDINEIQGFIVKRRDENNALSIRKIQIIADYGANLLKNVDVIMPFDYSGTVMAVLRRLAEQGKKLKLIVPESRSIDGGRPIVDQALEMGHTVHYIVDLAFPSYMHKIQAIIIGAEAIFANGDCWNTVGGYAISVIANIHKVPFYVVTDLIKIDPDSFWGVQKPIKPRDYSHIFKYPYSFNKPQSVSVFGPEIDKIPGNLITAYITEKGVVPPNVLYIETKRFLKEIESFN